MLRLAFLTLLPALALAFPGSVQGQDSDVEQTLALQRVMQRAIARAEPSIACILVSRSDEYKRLAGQAADASSTGQLGDFDPTLLGFAGEEASQQRHFLMRQRLDLADPGHVPEAFGSGVVIDPKGLVLTNYHVVRDATKVFVRLAHGKAGYADIHAADPRSDLAILRLRDARLLPLPAIALGDAAKVQKGQFALTITNPYAAGFHGGQPSAAWGIISNSRRRIPGTSGEEDRIKPLYYYGSLLQTDARTQLECSGGALLNLNGELIGLTTALAAIHGGDTPGGFALPLDGGLHRIINVLLRGEEVEYGFLGISFEKAAVGNGLVVKNVVPGSPAQQEAHLQSTDCILAVDDNPVDEKDDLFLQLGTRLAGTKVTLRVRHAGSTRVSNVPVTLRKFNVIGKRIASSTGNRPFFRGLRVDDTSLLVQQQPPHLFHIPAGALITDVQIGSEAAESQLKPGDVISHVNSRPVASPADFYRSVAAARGPVELQLYNFGSGGPPAKILVK